MARQPAADQRGGAIGGVHRRTAVARRTGPASAVRASRDRVERGDQPDARSLSLRSWRRDRRAGRRRHAVCARLARIAAAQSQRRDSRRQGLRRRPCRPHRSGAGRSVARLYLARAQGAFCPVRGRDRRGAARRARSRARRCRRFRRSHARRTARGGYDTRPDALDRLAICSRGEPRAGQGGDGGGGRTRDTR